MSAPCCYILDSDVFIEAARRYYAFDLVSSFWQTLVEQARNGRVQSIDRVKAEIDRGKDDLKEWANGDFHQWFLSTAQPDVIDAYRQIINWAHKQTQFIDAAKAEFSRAENADAWVIAYSMAKDFVIVTHEIYDPSIRRKIPIPNVCRALGVKDVDTFQMLRELGVRLG